MLSRRMSRVAPSAIMELIKTTAGGDYLSFASGLPDPALYPVEEIRAATDSVLTRDGRAALQYGAAEGYGPLREFVAEMLRGRGLKATPESVLITNGSQQSIDVAARALLDPGDGVVIESPSYMAALQAFDSYEAEYRTVPMDEQGMVTASLSPVLAEKPKLIYTLPNFQNPTGITLSADRRQELANAAAASGTAVLEDDAYHDLRYEGESLPTVCALAENPWAIYTGTFSKTVSPGLRVGYMCAAPELVERLAQVKQITDLHTGSLTQRIVYQYCVEGHLDPGIRRLRDVYRSRRDAMLAALEEHLTGVVRWVRPAGGMFIWVTLPVGRDADALLRKALEERVTFVPGRTFHCDGTGRNTLRLNFVSADEEKIRRGIAILAGVIRESVA